MRFKVCGMTKVTDIHRLGEMGVQFAGLIFYPPSPRYVLKHDLTGEHIRKEKFSVYKVGVFVNAPYEEIMKQVDDYGLDMVQLHGNETPYLCDKVSSYIQVIKAFRFAENDHVEWMLKDFYACTDMFMLDTGIMVDRRNGNPGKERVFNWNRLKGLQIRKPFFLSGGIAATDVASIREFLEEPIAADLFAIDLNSRFETAPGVKDLKQVERFMRELVG